MTWYFLPEARRSFDTRCRAQVGIQCGSDSMQPTRRTYLKARARFELAFPSFHQFAWEVLPDLGTWGVVPRSAQNDKRTVEVGQRTGMPPL